MRPAHTYWLIPVTSQASVTPSATTAHRSSGANTAACSGYPHVATRPPPQRRRQLLFGRHDSARGVGPQRRAVACTVDRQLEVPELVGVDLAEAEPGAVADQPLVGSDGCHVHRLPDNVFGHVGRCHELTRDVHTAVLGDGVVEQPLLEAL